MSDVFYGSMQKPVKEWHQTLTHLCERSEVVVRLVIDGDEKGPWHPGQINH